MTLILWEAVLLYSLTLISFVSPTTLVANLAQSETNGDTKLGTLSAPTLPKFFTNNPLPNGYPWGTKTANNSNPYEQSPTTGVIRPYTFVITRDFKAPDGVNRSVLLINGQIPGPAIEANWGDTIQVTVTNNITGPAEGTSLHWHGLIQNETPWFDGVPSVQQCPIAPGSTFTYSFKAGLYGTSWYHSHYSAQYADGLAGPIIIYGPTNAQHDIDLGPIVLSDWYHTPSLSIVESQEVNTTNAPTPPRSDNNLINGKGNVDCSLVPAGTDCVPNAGLSVFKFQSGKTHRLRLINAGAEGIQRFTIDGYEMTVIANDFVPVKPYRTNMVTLGVGQRTDVLVKAIGKPTDAVWMRSDISNCSLSNQPHALAAIYYEHADKTLEPTTIATTYNDTHCGNDDLDRTVPFFPYSPLGDPATTKEVQITFQQNTTDYWQWTTNDQFFRANYNDPLLLLANEGNTSYPVNSNIYDFGSNTSIRIVLYNDINVPIAHPMHLHGHNFWVVAEGTGKWNGSVNTINPQRRDTQLLQAGTATEPGYLVIQFNADNPGVWPFHCHIAWHVSTGLYMNIMERPKDITETVIPSIMQQTCTDWDAWSNSNVVDEIDSGL